jgi:hypothetical protein
LKGSFVRHDELEVTMAKQIRLFLWIIAGAVLVTIGASLYELDRRGQSQFDDLAGRVDELNANLRVLIPILTLNNPRLTNRGGRWT